MLGFLIFFLTLIRLGGGNIPLKFHLSLILPTTVDPGGNQTIFSIKQQDADLRQLDEINLIIYGLSSFRLN